MLRWIDLSSVELGGWNDLVGLKVEHVGAR